MRLWRRLTAKDEALLMSVVGGYHEESLQVCGPLSRQ
jgi:hypothetical protein